MKKLVCILAAFIVCLCITACDGKGGNSGKDSSKSTSTQSSFEEIELPEDEF